MKKYIQLLLVTTFLGWTACANKNVAVEEAQQLTPAEPKIVEGYDVSTTANSICVCLEEHAKKAEVDKKQASPTTVNVAQYKTICEKNAYMKHGAPTSSNIKLNIQAALQNQCGQYLKITNSSISKNAGNKKENDKGKQEPNRPHRKYSPPALEKE